MNVYTPPLPSQSLRGCMQRAIGVRTQARERSRRRAHSRVILELLVRLGQLDFQSQHLFLEMIIFLPPAHAHASAV